MSREWDCCGIETGYQSRQLFHSGNDVHDSSLDPYIGVLAALACQKQINNLLREHHLLYPIFFTKDIDIELENDKRD